MRIHKGDTVQIITGKDRGKRGKVLRLDWKHKRVLVEGLNVYKKHKRPTRQGAKGEVVQVSRPIAAANVQLFCSACDRPRRVGFRLESSGSKTRICKKCQGVI